MVGVGGCGLGVLGSALVLSAVLIFERGRGGVGDADVGFAGGLEVVVAGLLAHMR